MMRRHSIAKGELPADGEFVLVKFTKLESDDKTPFEVLLFKDGKWWLKDRECEVSEEYLDHWWYTEDPETAITDDEQKVLDEIAVEYPGKLYPVPKGFIDYIGYREGSEGDDMACALLCNLSRVTTDK